MSLFVLHRRMKTGVDCAIGAISLSRLHEDVLRRSSMHWR